MATLLFVAELFIIVSAQTVKRCTDLSECADSSIRKGKIVCSGQKSCSSATLTSTAVNGEVSCTGEQSCSGANVKANKGMVYCNGKVSCSSGQSSARNIQCGGDYSCTNSLMDAVAFLYCDGSNYACSHDTKTAGRGVYCDGFHSCSTKANNPDTIINSGGDIYCTAGYGCYDAKFTATGSILCGGSNSCTFSTLKADKSVKLYDRQGAGFVTISDTPLVEAYGSDSLYYTTIDSGTSLSKMTVRIFSVKSQSSKIKCRAGTECNVICKGSGCSGTEYQCEPGAICNIMPSGCSSNWGGRVNNINCPSYTEEISMNNDYEPDDIDVDLNDHELDISKIEPYSETYCNEQRSCSRQTLTNSRVTCSGFSSCNDAEIDASAIVYCYGEDSCLGSSIESTVLCYGAGSCDSAIMTTTSRSLLCDGFESCQYSDFGRGNGECNGGLSCKGAQFMTQETSFDCNGGRSCQDATIYAAGGRNLGIDCWGNYACANATINATGSITCLGTGSCHGASTYGGKVFANGYYSAYGANIDSAKKIIATGYMSMNYATIDSGDIIGDRVDIIMRAHSAGYGATVICRDGGNCSLTCNLDGCDNLDYLCYNGAVCDIEPAGCSDGTRNNIKGVNCPNIMSMSNDQEIKEFLEMKEMTKENDEIYQQIMDEIIAQNEQYESMRTMEFDEELSLFKEESLLSANNWMDNNMSLLIGSVGVVIMAIFALFYQWNKKKNDDYQLLE